MLQISREYGSIALNAPTEEKACQTDDLNLNEDSLDGKRQELIATNHINNNNNNTSSTFTSAVNINVSNAPSQSKKTSTSDASS